MSAARFSTPADLDAPRVRVGCRLGASGVEAGPELPFVIGVLADLAGNASRHQGSLTERSFRVLDVDTFANVLEELSPGLSYQVPNLLTGEGQLNVELSFQSFDDFGPAAIARRVPFLQPIYQARTESWKALVKAVGQNQAESWVRPETSSPDRRERESGAVPSEAPSPSRSSAAPLDPAELLRGALGRRSSEPISEARGIIDALARHIVPAQAGVPPESELRHLAGRIRELDRLLGDQVNAILRHPDFRRLEAAWTGIHFLATSVETSESLELRVLSLNGGELHAAIGGAGDAEWRQGALYRWLCDEVYGVAGASPFGCLIVDFAFDHSPEDVKVLQGLTRVAAVAQTPILAGAKPELLGAARWEDVLGQRDPTKALHDAGHLAWRALRQASESRLLGLTMPRFLGRLPHGASGPVVEEFSFSETVTGDDPSDFVWCNSAYLVGTAVARAFRQFGWCAQIRGREQGGHFADLPVHLRPGETGADQVCGPTEALVSNRAEMLLAGQGLIPVCSEQHTTGATLFSASTLHEPRKLVGARAEELQAAALLASRLPCVLAVCRFTQALKCLTRDLVGSCADAGSLQKILQDWLGHFVLENPDAATETTRAAQPLAYARIEVLEDRRSSGAWVASLEILPAFQLEGLTLPLKVRFTLVEGA